MEALCDTLASVINTHPNSPIWITGDINLPNINWERYCVDGNAYSIALCELFLDLIQEHGFTQVVDFPTRRNNTLDIFATNRPSLVTACKPVPGISDHEAVLVHSSMKVHSHPSAPRTVYKWNKADWAELKTTTVHFCTTFSSEFSVNTSVDHLWDKFKCFCQSVLSAIPSKVVNNKTSHTWITPIIKRLSKRKQRAYNKARLSHHQDDWAQYYNLKRECQRECRRAYNNYVTSLVDNNNNVSKRMWAYVKSKRIDHCGVAPLKQDEKTFINPKDKAEILNKYFTSVFTLEDISTIPILDHNTPSISPVVIHNEGVINLLSNLKEHKAKGPMKSRQHY